MLHQKPESSGFGETLAEEVRPLGIDVNLIAPGALNTSITRRNNLRRDRKKVGLDFYKAALNQRDQGGVSLELGARTLLTSSFKRRGRCDRAAGQRAMGSLGKT